jgi:hypothetical protein
MTLRELTQKEAAAEIERLRAALKEIRKTSIDEWEFQEGRVVAKVHMIAGAALEQKERRWRAIGDE